MARLLLVHGASPGEKDEDGHNPEEWHLLLGRSVLQPANDPVVCCGSLS